MVEGQFIGSYLVMSRYLLSMIPVMSPSGTLMETQDILCHYMQIIPYYDSFCVGYVCTEKLPNLCQVIIQIYLHWFHLFG